MRDYLIPECHYEQEVLIILGYSIKHDINKVSGCNGVISEIKKTYSDKLAIGWIDQDPTKQTNRHPDYSKYKQIESKYKVHLKQKLNTSNYLIEIEDEFEKWFEPIGKAKGVKKEDFKIQYDLHEFSKINIPSNVKSYLREVIEKNSAPFDYVRQLIERIKK